LMKGRGTDRDRVHLKIKISARTDEGIVGGRGGVSLGGERLRKSPNGQTHM